MSTIFSTYDIRGRAGDTLSAEQAWNVGKAFAEWLPENGAIVVTKTPETNETILHALIEGMLLQGRDILDGGDGDKESLTSYLNEEKAVGGVYVRHEAADNLEIITLLDRSGVDVTDQNGLTQISQMVMSGNLPPANVKGSVRPAK